MGAKPSSAVQSSAYPEALNNYIDLQEEGSLRSCLMGEHGNYLSAEPGGESEGDEALICRLL
jgi:hypothetical protein